MIDYKKLGRLFDSADQQKLDLLINVNTDPLISQYDEQFIKHGFVKVDNNRYNLKMSEDSKSVFQITKAIALEQINWLVGVISKILNDETDLKEIDRLRDQLTIEQLTHDCTLVILHLATSAYPPWNATPSPRINKPDSWSD